MSHYTDIIVNAQDISFCPGPCKYNKYKDNKVKIKNKTMYDFKPNYGGRYDFFEYPINYKDNIYLRLENLRICRSCYNRYYDMWNKKDYNSLEIDAYKIQKKLSLYAESLVYL